MGTLYGGVHKKWYPLLQLNDRFLERRNVNFKRLIIYSLVATAPGFIGSRFNPLFDYV